MARAIITGGSSGIGLATGHMMRLRGDDVISLDLNVPPDGSAWIAMDVADQSSVHAAVSRAAKPRIALVHL